MTEIVPIVPGSVGGGNNSPPPITHVIDTKVEKKQANPAKRWVFTWNNYKKEDLEALISAFSANSATLYVVGQEVGKSGTPHLQGYVEFKSRCRPITAIPLKVSYWKAAKGKRQENIDYCTKDGLFHTNFKIPKPIKTLSENTLYPWQSWLLGIVKSDPHDRLIYWIWETQGNVGKSAFCKFLAIKYGALMVDGKGNDIMQAIAGYKEIENVFPEIIIIDCPRHNIDYINYGAIEKVKNGHVFSGKYESKQLLFNIPHVIIFANNKPDMTKWSKDRYFVKELGPLDVIIPDCIVEEPLKKTIKLTFD